MDINELEKGMRGAANRKLNAGVEKHDPISAGQRFAESRTFPRILIGVAVISVLVLLLIGVSELAAIPPAHIMTFVLVLGVLGFWFGGEKRR